MHSQQTPVLLYLEDLERLCNFLGCVNRIIYERTFQILLRNEELLMRKPVEWVLEQYQKKLFLTAYNICKEAEDAKDVVQDTLIQYYISNKEFQDVNHLRSWLFRVLINKAKDKTKSFWRKNTEPLFEQNEQIKFETSEESDLFEMVMDLPEKYRIVIHLFYYEDLSIKEIAKMLRISESNVKVRLSRGRKILKEDLKEESL